MTHPEPRIAILGAGFAGLRAARELRRLLPRAVLTLVSPSREFIYLPSLIWIPGGQRNGDALRSPLDGFLRRHAIEHRQGSVTGLAKSGRTVLTDSGPLEVDALLIASGGRFLKTLPGIEHALTLCEGIPAAEAIGARLSAMRSGAIAFGFGSNPKEPSAMRGGPMFELLFGVDTWLRQQGRRANFRLTFFNPSAQPGQRLGDQAVAGLLAEMARRDIATHLGHKPLSFAADSVTTEGGRLPADLILFMPGLTGPAWAESSDLPLSPGGFFAADEFCRVNGQEKIYVAGDAGSYPGPDWLPKQAHMAELQAVAAAHNLAAELAGRTPFARPKAELACIIDDGAHGMLVYRSMKRNRALPASRLFHWVKRGVEWRYLRGLR